MLKSQSAILGAKKIQFIKELPDAFPMNGWEGHLKIN